MKMWEMNSGKIQTVRELPSVCKYEWWIILSLVELKIFRYKFPPAIWSLLYRPPRAQIASRVNRGWKFTLQIQKNKTMFSLFVADVMEKIDKIVWKHIYKTRYHSTDNRAASACTHKSSEWKEWRKKSENVENSFLRWGMESEKWERERQWGGKMEILCVCRCQKKL